MAPAAPGSSSRTGWLRTCSNDSGAARKPSAEADHRVGARVFALLHDVDARCCGHVLHHHTVDAGCGLDPTQAQLRAHPGQRTLRRIAIQRHTAAKEEAWIVIAQ